MISNLEQHISVKTARILGSVYFFLLGLINFVATFIYAEIRLLDLITVVVCALPFLMRKKMFLLVFGIVAACISVYGTVGGLVFLRNPQVHTSKIAFFMGFLLTGSAFLSSLLLIFAGSSDENLNPGSLSKA